MTSNSALRSKPLSGIKLTNLVYEELAKHAGEDFSVAELMQAAQQLIRISKGEYVDQITREYEGRPPYYALNTCTAFEYYPWQIAFNETYNMQNCDYPDYFPESLEKFRLISLGKMSK